MSEDNISCDCESDLDLKTPVPTAFKIREFMNPIISSLALILAYLLLHAFEFSYSFYLAIVLLALSYLLVGFSVIKKAFQLVLRGDFFNEFMLMTLATWGAFYIGDYIEGVFVMLFYSTGEIVQDNAVRSVRNAIRSLLDLQIKDVIAIRKGEKIKLHPEELLKGDHIQVLPGEMLPLDGIILDENVHLNTANITGESLARIFMKGESVLAGMICVEKPFIYEATANWDNSYITKIMHLVEEAANKKAKTQRLISRLAKVYTPIVFFLAVALIIAPYFIVETYNFDEWLYRGLVFLVISCPCAFLIAIPLSYFGGIGLAAKRGILFKGGEVIEKIKALKSIVFDKTGTLTYGTYVIESIAIPEDKSQILSLLREVESHSKHPIAIALVKELKDHSSQQKAENIREYPGKGIEAAFDDVVFLAGNASFLASKEIEISESKELLPCIHIAFNGAYRGKIVFSDQLREEAKDLVHQLRVLGIKSIAMLSGDKQEIANAVGSSLKLDFIAGDLLPEEKVSRFLELRRQNPPAAFVGDGVNDAPVLASADVGIAMGAYGSDSAIQSADVVIEDDDLMQIPVAISIAQKTQKNVWQNLLFAIVVKILVLLLGALGYAGLWEAIFADVGVALLVVMNAYRLKNLKV